MSKRIEKNNDDRGPTTVRSRGIQCIPDSPGCFIKNHD